ncbi:DUF305 domain-containing protein [Leifsonia bigeumensis]|uniref:DUF305 domain-containing protein n=1 Tax=Leifsonella bigeumensis TaxID=433643 RepID=A0ABP7FCX3_9MICO
MAPERSADTGAAHAVPTRTIVLAILGVAALVIAGFLAGRLTTPAEVVPNDTSAEAGFARDMQLHHQQAVEMSMIVRDETDDPDIRLLAYDIALAQQQQAGQMFSWLTVWGLPQAASEPSMTWMVRPGRSGTGHDHGAGEAAHVPGEPMPGLATDEQMAELSAATGVEAENLYLTLMIAHHKGGIDMAEAILDRSTNRVVTNLARGMIAAQQSEIDYMQELLAQRQ